METASYRFNIKVQYGHLIAGLHIIKIPAFGQKCGLRRSVTSAEDFSSLCCSLIPGLATGPILPRVLCLTLTLLMSSSLIPES